jgi:hypothetical protein
VAEEEAARADVVEEGKDKNVGKAGRRDGCRRERQIGAREMGERLGKTGGRFR